MLYRRWSQARINEPFILLCLGVYVLLVHKENHILQAIRLPTLSLIKMLLYIRTEDYVYCCFVHAMACMYFRERNLILRALRLFLYTTIQKYNRTESIPGKYIVAFQAGPSTDNIHYGHKQ